MFFPDVLSRQRVFRHEKPIETCCFCCVCHVNLLILVKMCCFPFCSSLLMSAEVLLSYLYIYIACIYFGFWFSIFGLTSTKRVFEHVSQRIKGAFKSQGPDFTTENMRNTSKRLMSDGTSTWEVSSLFLLGPTPNMSTLLKSMYNIYIYYGYIMGNIYIYTVWLLGSIYIL